MVASSMTWVGRMLIGNDGSRLGTIEEVVADEETGEPQWLAVRPVRGATELRVVPARGTTERGIKDVVTWLDDKDLARAPGHLGGEQAAVEPELEPEPEPEPEPVAPAAATPAPPPPSPTRRRAGTNLTEIEGLGPDDARVLVAAGVRTIDGLLETAGSAAGRRSLARLSGIDTGTLLEWVNRADLMRIHGVGSEYSDLLETAGVDSVKELGTRKPVNLQRRMAEINDQDQLVRRAPSLAEVERWVAEAKTLPVVVTH